MFQKKFRISLKIRIFAIFFGILCAAVLMFIISFYRFISKSTFENLNKDYLSMANDLNDTSQNLLWKLTLVSQQLLENEDIQNTITLYEETEDFYQKQLYYSQLLDLVSSLTMSETDIALFYFYDPVNDDIIYSSLPVDHPTHSGDYLYRNDLFKYWGPVDSQSNFLNNPVFTLERISILPNGNPLYFSIESGYYSLDKPFTSLMQKSAYVVFTNEEGKILYSSIPDDEQITLNMDELLSGKNHSFHVFSQQTSQGWSTYVIVPHSIYTSQYKDGLREFTKVTLLFSILLAVLAFLFWKSIYYPLQLIERKLNLIVSNEEFSEENPSSIPEFDFLFRRIKLLQQQVQEMLAQAVIKEKENTRIQLEKLRAQINPHFLMNTLNTIHWLALMNEQTEIDEITQSLSHLLSYNLDKDSYNTNLQRELNAINEYVRLQKVRYAFAFTTEVDPVQAPLNYPCPKFILQPLIENSLSHGYRENMDIHIGIHVLENEIEILVSDTGVGMSTEQLSFVRELVHSSQSTSQDHNVSINQSSGKGIGISYVAGILQLYYGTPVTIDVQSEPDVGTTFRINLPKMKGTGYHVKNSDY